MTEVFFWFVFLLVVYTYVGYGIILFILVKVKRIFSSKNWVKSGFTPNVTLLIPSYNEAPVLLQKIRNTQNLQYPAENLSVIFITDGSTDGSPQIIRDHSQYAVLHAPGRKGKIAAIERALEYVNTDFIVFTDANTMLNKRAVLHLVRHFEDVKIGAVAGEKRIQIDASEEASGAGEGLYWKYESMLKKWDAELYSVVGAAGELFAVRSNLYPEVSPDTIIEDFYITLTIARQGYRVAYEPDAYALESPSASLGDEMKRKIRIAAGGLQAVARLRSLLNPLRYGVLSFQYISHRVLRWTAAPAALPVIFILNGVLAIRQIGLYPVLFGLQILFYLLAWLGMILESQKIRLKILFVPFYFCFMNYAVYRGFFKLIGKKQTVVWEKAERRS